MPGETSLQFSLSRRNYSTVARRCLLCEEDAMKGCQIMSRLPKRGRGLRRYLSRLILQRIFVFLVPHGALMTHTYC
jgi:hypothetical protein